MPVVPTVRTRAASGENISPLAALHERQSSALLFSPCTSLQLICAHAQVYVPLRLFFTLSCKVIKNALGNGLRRSIVEHDSIQTDVHFFRDQRNRFKFRIALTLFNLNDGSGTHIKPF